MGCHNDPRRLFDVLGGDFEASQMPRIAGPGIGRDEIRRSRTAMGHWEKNGEVSIGTRCR